MSPYSIPTRPLPVFSSTLAFSGVSARGERLYQQLVGASFVSGQQDCFHHSFVAVSAFVEGFLHHLQSCSEFRRGFHRFHFDRRHRPVTRRRPRRKTVRILARTLGRTSEFSNRPLQIRIPKR